MQKNLAFLDITADELILSLVSISRDELIALNENPDAYTTIRLSKERKLIHVEGLASIFPRNNLPKSEHAYVLVEQPIHFEELTNVRFYGLKEKHQLITNKTIRLSPIETFTTDTSVVINPPLRQKLGHVMHRNVDNFFDSFFPMS